MSTFTDMVDLLQQVVGQDEPKHDDADAVVAATVVMNDAWRARARAVLAQVYKDTVANAPTSTTVSFDSRP